MNWFFCVCRFSSWLDISDIYIYNSVCRCHDQFDNVSLSVRLFVYILHGLSVDDDVCKSRELGTSELGDGEVMLFNRCVDRRACCDDVRTRSSFLTPIIAALPCEANCLVRHDHTCRYRKCCEYFTLGMGSNVGNVSADLDVHRNACDWHTQALTLLSACVFLVPSASLVTSSNRKQPTKLAAMQQTGATSRPKSSIDLMIAALFATGRPESSEWWVAAVSDESFFYLCNFDFVPIPWLCRFIDCADWMSLSLTDFTILLTVSGLSHNAHNNTHLQSKWMIRSIDFHNFDANEFKQKRKPTMTQPNTAKATL